MFIDSFNGETRKRNNLFLEDIPNFLQYALHNDSLINT